MMASSGDSTIAASKPSGEALRPWINPCGSAPAPRFYNQRAQGAFGRQPFKEPFPFSKNPVHLLCSPRRGRRRLLECGIFYPMEGG
jgi:hypothetical protein